MLHPGVYGVLAGEQGRPTGSAQCRDVVAVEDHAVVGEGVDVGRGYLVAAVEAHVVPAHVVRDYHYYVRRTLVGVQARV